MKTLSSRQKKKKRQMPSYFGKEKLLKACFGIIPSFTLFLDYLYCLGGDISISIKHGGFAKAQSSNQILINTEKLGGLTETCPNFLSDSGLCKPHLL